jgi:N-acetylneuraminic acid mutarotase
VVDGKVYIFGGEDPGQTYSDGFVYDMATDSWGTTEPMPTPRHGLGVGVYDGQIHVIGGGTSPSGGSDTSIHEILTP